LEIALGIAFGAVVVASLWAASRFISSPGSVLSEEGRAMRAALHAATATLPHLRRGLSAATAARAVPHLRALTQSTALALADREALLAIDGSGAARALTGSPNEHLFEEGPDDRVHVDPSLELPELHVGGAVVAPLVVRGDRVGSLAAFYARGRRIRPEDTRVVGANLEVDLVGLELDQGLAGFNVVAFMFEPPRYARLVYRFAQLWNNYIGHVMPVWSAPAKAALWESSGRRPARSASPD